MALERLEPKPFEVDAGGFFIRGEEVGEGPPIVLLHGITATRRYVVHGSFALARSGYRLITYDARGHGESDPAPAGQGYTYEELARDLEVVLAALTDSPPVVGGHSLGCHTAATWALENAGEPAGLVFIGPVNRGMPAPPEVLAYWDGLAEGLEADSLDGFMRAYEQDLAVAPEWREKIIAITRERIGRHRQPEAFADALRQVARSQPFEGLAELESLDVPALVVASHDDADPTHPYSVAEAWADALPNAELISEERGQAPLAWQGGRLSREIAAFCERPEVAARLRGSS
jgi:pimeloyl-ACP methyl ester carboxylesterase